MRLKITTTKEPVHGSCVTCVGWSNTEEVFTAGYINVLLFCFLLLIIYEILLILFKNLFVKLRRTFYTKQFKCI